MAAGLSRINVGGTDFTRTNYNANMQYVEDLHTYALGYGVISGLTLTAGTGFNVVIANGVFLGLTVRSLSSIPNFACPSSSTSYLWIDELGNVTRTATTTSPGGVVGCLGKVVTDGSGVTSITYDNRDDIGKVLQDVSQSGGMTSKAVSTGSYILTPSEYGSRVLKFTGTLVANVNVIVPNLAGQQWTVIDATTGAFTVTVKTNGGSGFALTHSKTVILICDGTDILQATANL